MELPFVPMPQRYTFLTGVSQINENTHVVLQIPHKDERLLKCVKKIFNQLTIKNGRYALFSDEHNLLKYEMGRPEGYLLNIKNDSFQLASQDANGLFYGVQTLQQWFQMSSKKCIEIMDWPDLLMRSDYLDMRGIYPKFDKIIEYVQEMAQYKINTLTVEYEDKLPRSRKQFCHPTETWTEKQLRDFLQIAHDNFIDIIPLQQTFGHLEYALKTPEYIQLRETVDSPGEICPLRKGAVELSTSLIEETANLHPNSKWIHLGCDEVWSLGQSLECQASGLSRGKISIDFINQLVDKTVALGKIPIIWHDMIAEANDDELAQLNSQVIVAIWLYSPDTVATIAPNLMERLHSFGIRTIPCCSVRASDRAAGQNYPCVEQRIRNIDAWCKLIRHTRSIGMINTNWCSTFSLGNPYGLFETSRYTAFYAAERCWNLSADTTTFLERFLCVYHGIHDVVVSNDDERKYDYYKIIGKYLPIVKRNKLTAQLIEIMYRLEYAVPVNYTIFRGILFPGNKVEMSCLNERAKKDYLSLSSAEKDLKELLPQLLDSEMANLFFESRTFTNKLFQHELEKILGYKLR